MMTALPRPLLAAWNTFVLDEHAQGHPAAGPVGQKWLAAPDGAGLWKLLREAGLV